GVPAGKSDVENVFLYASSITVTADTLYPGAAPPLYFAFDWAARVPPPDPFDHPVMSEKTVQLVFPEIAPSVTAPAVSTVNWKITVTSARTSPSDPAVGVIVNDPGPAAAANNGAPDEPNVCFAPYPNVWQNRVTCPSHRFW